VKVWDEVGTARFAAAVLLLGITLVPRVTLAAEKPDSACGYPNYCARTDRRPEPYPDKLPPLGPAGSTFTDPSFNSRMVRVTDANTDPRKQGQSFHTPASAEQNSWNSDTTKFYVIEAGGQKILYAFDPAKMTAREGKTLDVAWQGEPEFSYTQPNILYGMPTKGVDFQQYDLAKGKSSTLHDPASCLKLDSSLHGFDITVTADDKRFMTLYGPRQNDSYVLYIYDRDKGCRWYNTQTGEIGGNWGPKGTVSTADRYSVHNARMAKSGKYVYLTHTGGGWFIWDVETTNVTACDRNPNYGCGGHHALGYTHILTPSGKGPMDLRVHSLSQISSFKPLFNDLPVIPGIWYDKHFSWNNVDPGDTNPACMSSSRTDNSPIPGTPLKVTGPWENEIDCVETDGKGSKIWRFAHTFSTATNGFWSTPRGNVSQDGRFYMFTSDWENTLGNALSGGSHRTDVFIVELR
jgi:hypothetical protein